jgi:hypothetical protein
MAQLLGDAGLPGEAHTVLTKALSQGVVKDEQKERVTRLIDALTAREDADESRWALFERAARESTTGELGLKLGEMRYAAGDYPGVIVAITAGMEKGQIKHTDEAYVYLGLSQAAMGNDAAAQEAFGKLNTVPGIDRRVLNLWQLYAETSLQKVI